MTSLRVVSLFAVASAAAGCFDVKTGGRAPLLIDNFDGVDDLPADHHFDQWRCGEFNPDTKQSCECGYDDVTYHSSPYSIYLNATVVEAGDQQSAGAQLYTQADVPEDLSSMNEIVFSAKFARGNPPIPGTAPFYVELHCAPEYVGKGSSSNDVYVHSQVENWQSNDWKVFVIGMSKFNFPWEGTDPTECLEHVDGIHFSVNAGLSLGGKGSFALNIDDIYFQ